MGLRKHGAEIAREQCRSTRGAGAGALDIVVPVSLDDTGLAGTARLRLLAAWTGWRIPA